MPRLDILSSARSFTTMALVAVMGVAVPGLAAAQAWDWDEDFVPAEQQSEPQSCSAEDGGLDVWLDPGTITNTDGFSGCDVPTWS